jgi:hypothetical protein
MNRLRFQVAQLAERPCTQFRNTTITCDEVVPAVLDRLSVGGSECMRLLILFLAAIVTSSAVHANAEYKMRQADSYILVLQCGEIMYGRNNGHGDGTELRSRHAYELCVDRQRQTGPRSSTDHSNELPNV